MKAPSGAAGVPGPSPAGVRRWHAELAWLPGQEVQRDVLIEAVGDRFTAVAAGRSWPDAPAGTVRLKGLTLPGLANAHSHAFHRALRGITQAGRGTFWTWRDRMYQVAGRLSPESYLALARAVYAEMSLAGVTCVGEFHYLHHRPDGAGYADPNAMGRAILAAAAEAGVRITLLDTCYLAGGLSAGGRPEPLSGPQLRFGDGDARRWAARVEALSPDAHGMLAPHARAGAAIHSVRAVPPGQLRPVIAWTHRYGAPLHAHLSEQPAENTACQAAYGASPAEVLYRAGALGPRATMVHATHLTGRDIELLGGSRVCACFCPTTEADLADGIGPARALASAGSPLSVGSDSHAVVDLFAEARGIELTQRLATGQRGQFSAAELATAATVAGHACLGWPDAGEIVPGALADLVTVALDTPRLAGATRATVLESAVFAATAADVRSVVTGGRDVVRDGRHLLVDDVPAALAAAIAPVLTETPPWHRLGRDGLRGPLTDMSVANIYVADTHVGNVYAGVMETGFVGRQDERARLEEWWAGPAPRPALVWGRRRVGKTALLQRFAEGRRFVFHTGANRAGNGELAEFSRQAAVAVPDARRDLAARPYHSWDEAFDSLSRHSEAGPAGPLLLVIDEFPEVAAAVPDITGILRAFLDRSHGRSGLRILLCGSAVRTMRAIQEYRSPLYGRFDLTMRLHPFRPHEAAEMLSALGPADRAVVYGIVGGMPLYLSWWQQDAPVRDNLMRLACTPDGRMLAEGDLVLATEAGQGEHMAAVLRAIAAGRTRHNEIADDTRIDPTRTLNDLVTLRLIERLQPVTETGRTRRRIYRITDNFLAFFLGVLSPFRGEIERGLGRTVINAVTSSIDDHMGPAWEEAFRDHLRLRAVSGLLDRDDAVAIGPWWRDGGSEIDAVGLAGRGRVPFLAGESKWSAHVNAARMKATLTVKAAEVTPEPGSLRYVVCGREQVERADPDTLVITAADIFAAP